MPAAISQAEVVGYIAEATWGVTPATPAFRTVRHTGIGTGIEKQTTESAEVTTARATADIIRTAQRGALTINHELSYDTQFEDWLLGLLGQTAWTANVAKVGTTRRSFTIQRHFPDAGQFLRFAGAIPAKMAISVGIGNVINGSTEFRSLFPTQAAAAIAGATVVAAGANSVMDPISSVQLIQEGGAGSVAGPTEFSFELENGIVDLPQLANVDPLQMELGEFRAKGRFACYFQDATYWTKMAAHTTTSLSFTLGGPATLRYNFFFPKVKLTAVDVPNGGKNQPIIQTYEWAAFNDATDSICRVTRTP